MNLEEIVSKINSKEGTRAEIAESLGMSNTSLSRELKKGGYEWDNSAKKYFFTSPNPETQEENKPVNKETNKEESNPPNKQEKKEVNKKENKKSIKQEIQETKKEERKPKKVTYEIDEDLHYELRMLSFRQKKNVSELVEQAIRQYLRE